jgi:hypothetical protein
MLVNGRMVLKKQPCHILLVPSINLGRNENDENEKTYNTSLCSWNENTQKNGGIYKRKNSRAVDTKNTMNEFLMKPSRQDARRWIRKQKHQEEQKMNESKV